MVSASPHGSIRASKLGVAGGGWLVTVIALAAAMLLVEVALAAQHAAWIATRHPHAAAVAVVAAVVLMAALVAGLFGTFHEVSAWARAAVVLAAVQAALALAALGLWLLILRREPFFAEAFPLADAVPLPALVAGGLVVLGALVTPPRSASPRWLVALATLALTTLVGAALWLPIYSELHPVEVTPDVVRAALPAVLGPALALAAIVTAVSTWRRSRRDARGWRFVGGLLGAWTLGVALLCAPSGDVLTRPWLHLITQFAPVLLGLAWFATLAVIGLAVAHVRSARRVARLRRETVTCHGTIVVAAPASTVVAMHVNRGWLAGPAPRCLGFTLRTARGEVQVPAGVDVVAPLPPWAAEAGAGMASALLGDGDEVDVVGFEAPTDGDAYRHAATPMFATRGIAVMAPRRDDEPVRRDVLLRLWQPCAVLLGACVVAALPTLVAVLR